MEVSEDGALDTTASIETPEHVRFGVRIAGPSRRGFAYLIDLLIRGAIVTVFALVAELAGMDVDFGEMSSGALLVVLFAVDWGYYILLETIMNGQTPGKRALGLRTVKEGGYPVTFVDIVLRNLLRAADWLPAFNVVGLTVMAFDPQFRRIGDLVAGTMVVSEERTRLGAALLIEPPPTPAELEFIPASATLQGNERDALELFLRRRGALSMAREDELAGIVAGQFAARLGVEVTDPSRFLALLYLRCSSATPVASAPVPQRRRWRRA